MPPRTWPSIWRGWGSQTSKRGTRTRSTPAPPTSTERMIEEAEITGKEINTENIHRTPKEDLIATEVPDNLLETKVIRGAPDKEQTEDNLENWKVTKN